MTNWLWGVSAFYCISKNSCAPRHPLNVSHCTTPPGIMNDFTNRSLTSEKWLKQETGTSSIAHQLDQLKTEESIAEESLPASNSSMTVLSKPPVDGSGNPIKYNQNDVFLSMKNSVYKAVMYEQFRKMGIRSYVRGAKGAELKDRENIAAKEIFERFKKRGGRFFMLKQNAANKGVLLDDKLALESKCLLLCVIRIRVRQGIHSMLAFGFSRNIQGFRVQGQVV